MEKFSIGILSWHSTDDLITTLTSYHDNGLLYFCDDVTLYFQEINETDKAIAKHYNIKYIGTSENIGIGQAFIKLVEKAKYDKVLLLEHDWNLIEPIEIVKSRIESGLILLDSGYDCIRYRSRKNPGYPHFSIQKYQGRELEYYDPEIKLEYPHLLDSIHWLDDPDKTFPGKIGVQEINGEKYYVSSSRYGNFTNNPCLYRKKFYLDVTKPHAGSGIALEGNISYAWARAAYNVAHGEGIFRHYNPQKYGR